MIKDYQILPAWNDELALPPSFEDYQESIQEEKLIEENSLPENMSKENTLQESLSKEINE